MAKKKVVKKKTAKPIPYVDPPEDIDELLSESIEVITDQDDERFAELSDMVSDWLFVIRGYWGTLMGEDDEVQYYMGHVSAEDWVLQRSHLTKTYDENGDSDLDCTHVRIVAVARGVPVGTEIRTIAQSLYDAATNASGYAVTESTDYFGDDLVEP